MLTTTKKIYCLIGGLSVIILLAFALLSSDVFLTPEQRAEKELIDEMKRLGELEANDTFGGATPEETLELFIVALEAEDIELASKYFIVSEREKLTSVLKQVEDLGNLDQMADEARQLERTFGKNKENAFFITTNSDEVVEVTVILTQNKNKIWKITDL